MALAANEVDWLMSAYLMIRWHRKIKTSSCSAVSLCVDGRLPIPISKCPDLKGKIVGIQRPGDAYERARVSRSSISS
jgi:hypothetical protein